MGIPWIMVIGGINGDIAAAVEGSAVVGSSTPGRVRISPGGVGRNIAHGLARLGVPVALLGCGGRDPVSEWVLATTAAAGVDVTGVVRAEDTSVGLYVSILERGELAWAVADMEGIEGLDGDTIRTVMTRMTGDGTRTVAPAWIVVDLNLRIDAIQAVVSWANERGVPVLVEPVSVTKAERLAAIRGEVAIVTPNSAEAAVLRGMIARGEGPTIGRMIVTRGRFGAAEWVVGDDRAALFPGIPVATRNANGAGDAFVAALVATLTEDVASRGGATPPRAGVSAGTDQARDLGIARAIEYALAAGRIVAGSEASVDDSLTRDALEIERRRIT